MVNRLVNPMDPRRLETFRRVALTGSVSGAAREMALSQPAVTAQIRALESEVGQALFLREHTGMRLTAAGQRLMAVARRMNALLLEAAQGFAELHLGPLEVGASTTAAAYLLPPMLAGFLKQYPDVPVRVVNGNTETMLSAIREGKLSLALVEGLPRAAGLTLKPYLADELVLVGAAGMTPRPRHLQDLAHHRMLWREPGSGTRAVVERALGRARRPQARDLELGSTEAIKTAVIQGLGLGFLSRLSIQRELSSGLLIILPIADLHISRTFTWVHGSGALPASEEALLRMAEQQQRSTQRPAVGKQRPTPNRR